MTSLELVTSIKSGSLKFALLEDMKAWFDYFENSSLEFCSIARSRSLLFLYDFFSSMFWVSIGFFYAIFFSSIACFLSSAPCLSCGMRSNAYYNARFLLFFFSSYCTAEVSLPFFSSKPTVFFSWVTSRLLCLSSLWFCLFSLFCGKSLIYYCRLLLTWDELSREASSRLRVFEPLDVKVVMECCS